MALVEEKPGRIRRRDPNAVKAVVAALAAKFGNRLDGPNALRGSGPNPNLAFEDALTLAGSPDPRNDRVCITSLCPRQFLMTFCRC